MSFKAWCERYGYKPDSQEARENWERSRANLDALQRAAARSEAREAIERIQEQSRDDDSDMSP